MEKQYQNYSVRDFVMDEHFQQWVMNAGRELNQRWERWMERHPEKKPEVEEASSIILSLDFKKTPADRINDRQMLEYIMAEIKSPEKQNHFQENPTRKLYHHEEKSSRSMGFLGKIAAAVSLLILCGISYLLIVDQGTVEYATGYGEMKTIVLPDSSVVTLNANSQLTFNRGWGTGYEQAGLMASLWPGDEPREVWLEGEGYFQVQKIKKMNNEEGQQSQPDHKNFMVHTGDMNVEVLGTQFNVKNRRGKTQVVLDEGVVKLNLMEVLNEKVGADGVLMEPGELVEYSRKSKEMTQKKVDPEVYTSWQDNLLVFNHTSLTEIKNMIEDNYGKAVEISSDSLAEMTFTAKIPKNDLEILLKAIEESFNLKIQRKENRIIIGNKTK